MILPKVSPFITTFKVKDGDKDKNNQSMSFHIDDEKLFEKYKTIWTKIEDITNIKFNTIPVYDNRYIKTKIRKYYDKVYTNFCGLNVPEDDAECGSFTVISIDSLLAYENKYYLQVYLDNCAYKIVGKRRIDYLGDNLYKTDKDQCLINGFHKCCITMKLI